jgi:hypothetical protein
MISGFFHGCLHSLLRQVPVKDGEAGTCVSACCCLQRWLWKRFDARAWSVFCVSYVQQAGIFAAYQVCAVAVV